MTCCNASIDAKYDYSLLNRAMWSHLVVSEPDPVVCDAECEDVVHERLTFGVIVWCGECLQQKT